MSEEKQTPWGSEARSRSERLHSLDGLRGLAALSVVVTHYLATFFPRVVFGTNGQPGNEWQDALSRFPLFGLYGGSFAVFIFFSLSGFVIARSASASKVPFVLLAGRRYARLTVPALFSTLLAYVLLRAFPQATQAAAELLGNGWLADYYRQAPTLFQAAWDALFNPYRFGTSASNRVLWTMRTELFGSVGLYGLYRICPRRFLPLSLVLTSFLAIPQIPFIVGFLGFSGGALIYEAWSRGRIRPSPFGPVLVLAGLLLGGYPMQSPGGTLFAPLVSAARRFTSPFEFILGIGALLLVAGTLMWPAALRVLSWGVFRFLGRISFSLYVLHFPLLGTLALAIFLKNPASPVLFLGLSMGYFAGCIGAAYLLTILLDEPVVRLLRHTDRLPPHAAHYWVHLVVLGALLTFSVSRLGPEAGSLVVMTLAYAGTFFLLPLVLTGWIRDARALTPLGGEKVTRSS